MEKAAQYEECTKEELIKIIVDQDQTIRELSQAIVELKKEIEALKRPVPKDSTNSSIPSSKDMIKRTRSQREKSGKKPGGQAGHVGHHREYHAHPDKIIKVEASHCADCGASLSRIEGTIGLSRHSSYYAGGYAIPTSHQGLSLRAQQLSAVAPGWVCTYRTTDGSLDHVFECGTQPSLWATHPDH